MWRGDSCLVVVKVWRFLWSVMILNAYEVPSSSGRHSSRALIIAKSSLS